MKTAHVLAAIVVVALSIPFLAQQTNATQQQSEPTQSQQSTQPTAQANRAQALPAADMSPVKGELVEKLDSKTAKAGDSVVIKTKSTMKTADGTEIPKGSKLVGHVTGVKPSGQGSENSQMSLQFDRVELKSGQTVAIQSQIKSLSLPGGEPPSGATDAMNPATGAATGNVAAAGGSMPGGAGRTATGSAAQQPSQPSTPAEASTVPAAGTVVAHSGDIAIRTTAIPGVLLANNEPGHQDPRMGQSSSILIGAKRDIHLDGGTEVVMEVATAGAAGGN